MKKDNYGKLSIMMFLQYAVWGLWLPILARYLQSPVEVGGLGFTAGQVGWILGTAGSLGALAAPFAGQFADRNFSAERTLAFLLFAGGIVKFATAFATGFWPWLILSSAYSVLYMPTISLTNSIVFANTSDPDKSFPFIRVWGTIGWIAASWLFPLFWLTTNIKGSPFPPFYTGDDVAGVVGRLVDSLKVSGTISILYAGYCLLLPHTPPNKEVKELALSRALALFNKRSFTVLVAASLPVSIVHQIYFMQTAPFLGDALGLKDNLIGPAMSIGQFAEIGVMAMLAIMLKRLGIKWVVMIGIFAYMLRYAIFGTTALGSQVIIASQALHGFCFACFFAAGFIYVDRIAPDDIKSSAQTVFGIIILGIGPLLAAPLLQFLAQTFTTVGVVGADGQISDVMNYSALWYTLSGIALMTLIFFGVMFVDESPETNQGAAETITTGEKNLTEGLD